MERREFVAAGIGGAVVVLAGVGAVLGGESVRAGPNYGSIPGPPSDESTVLDNGRRASLYEDGRLAFFGAALVSQHSGLPAIVGRVKNVSASSFEQVRVEVQFVDDAGAVLAQGWIAEDDLAPGEVWQFTVSYSGGDPDRLADGAVLAFDVV